MIAKRKPKDVTASHALAHGTTASGFKFGAVVDVVSDGEFSCWKELDGGF